jgi:hypothetical protein
MPYNTQELLTQYKKSGLTRKEFCKKNSISLTALQYHFDKSKQVTSSQKQPRPSFISVPVSAPAPVSSTIVVIRGNYSASEIAAIINEAHG